jgi:hypothetical protein
MRDIEQARLAPDGPVFFNNPGILDRHLPATEWNHLCAELAMDLEERGAFQGSGGLAHFLASWADTTCGGNAACLAGPDLGGRIMVELTHVRVKEGSQ